MFAKVTRFVKRVAFTFLRFELHYVVALEVLLFFDLLPLMLSGHDAFVRSASSGLAMNAFIFGMPLLNAVLSAVIAGDSVQNFPLDWKAKLACCGVICSAADIYALHWFQARYPEVIHLHPDFEITTVIVMFMGICLAVWIFPNSFARPRIVDE